MTPPPDKFEPQSLKSVLQEIKGQKNLSRGFHQQAVEAAWEEITGPLVCKYTTEVLWSRNTIRVRISSAPLRKELSTGLDQLKKNLEERLPDLQIKGVVLT